MGDDRDRAPAVTEGRPPGRRFGYLLAAAINGVLLWVSHHLLEWGWPSFLTEDFEQVLPILSASFVATIVANVLFVAHDPRWFRALAESVTSALSLVAAVRMWQVFPFDFSTMARDWSTLARVLIAVGIAGLAVAVVANVVTFLAAVAAGPGSRREQS